MWSYRSGQRPRPSSAHVLFLAYSSNPQIDLLRPLGSILGATLLAIGYSCRVQRSAHHVITYAGQVFHAASTYEHDRVLLQVVSNARNVGRHLNSVGETDTRNFAQRRIRLFRRLRINAGTDAAPLRARLKRRAGRFVLGRAAAFS